MAQTRPLSPQAIAFIQALAVAAAREDHERDLAEKKKDASKAA